MKRFYIQFILFTCFFYSFNLFSQTTFVNHAATGNNDGSSWVDAYTDLDVALQNTTSGEVWVAAGTYTPGGDMPDTLSRFDILGSLSLYGGFAGTETSLDERDIENNVTILSGDTNGDDVQGDFDNNRGDNTHHVIYVDSLISGPVLIDGLVISDGHTSDSTDQSTIYYRGGGIFSYSAVQVESCLFTNNYGNGGASVYLAGGGTSGSVINECSFMGNRGSEQCAGVLIVNADNVQVTNSDFIGNEANRGCVYPSFSINTLVDNCLFQDNINFNDGWGCAFFSWQSVFTHINNCEFIGNSSANAGAMYLDGRDVPEEESTILIENTTFEDNSVTGWGGGSIYSWRESVTINNCTFNGGSAPNSASHVYFGGDDGSNVIQNSTFSNGQCFGWGASVVHYGTKDLTLDNCTFTNNSASNIGGAVYSGFQAVTNVIDCDFVTNSAGQAGAIGAQNDSTITIISGSHFESNSAAGGTAGAIGSSVSESSPIWSVSGSSFLGNMADFGAAIGISEFGQVESSLEVHDCEFVFNFADSQGGAINLSNTDASISNTVFHNNVATDPGTGGAISTNSSGGETMTVSMINNTLVDNIGDFAPGVAQWTESDTSYLTLTLQNNIFRNSGDNYVIEAGSPVVISNGGNLDHNSTMVEELTNAADIQGMDPLLVDPDNFDYHLQEGSPCIDAGVADGAPELDQEGNFRGDIVDIGALEYNIVINNEEVIPNEGVLKLFPNPVGKELNIVLDNEWNDLLQIQIFDVFGKSILLEKVPKTQENLLHTIAFDNLPAGQYYFTISNGKEIIVEKLSKF